MCHALLCKMFTSNPIFSYLRLNLGDLLESDFFIVSLSNMQVAQSN